MSFFCYYTPSVASFMERDSDRLAADIVRKLSQPNPFAVLMRQEQAAQAILKKGKKWKKKLRKARRMVAKLNKQAKEKRPKIETRIQERYAGERSYTIEELQGFTGVNLPVKLWECVECHRKFKPSAAGCPNCGQLARIVPN